MKIVINACFGGFNLSPFGVKELARRKGKECYFFTSPMAGPYEPLTINGAEEAFIFTAFSIPHPNEVLGIKKWSEMSAEEKAEHNEMYDKYSINKREIPRDDKDLVELVEEFGDKMSGCYARLKVVEIPDGVEWEIEEYDGNETIAEKHRTWR